MPYIRNPFNGKSFEDLNLYLQTELLKLEGIFKDFTVDSIRISPTSTEPDNPLEGHIYYADGVEWNPGYGNGPYAWLGNEWSPLFLTTGIWRPAHQVPRNTIKLNSYPPRFNNTTQLVSPIESSLYLNSIAPSVTNTSPPASTWAQLGNELSVSSGEPMLAAMNSTDVAHISVTTLSELRTYRFDGADWSQVGNGLTISTDPGYICALNSTDIAYIDSSNDELRTYRFDGADWSQVGNSLSITGVGELSIATLNATDIAFYDLSNQELRTYRFDGTDWSQAGNSLSLIGFGRSSLAAMNGTQISMVGGTNGKMYVYSFDGTDWSQVGNHIAITPIGYPDITAINSTDVAFVDSVNDEIRTYRFSDGEWTLVGTPLSIAGTNVLSPVVSSLDFYLIAYCDGSNNKLRVYRWF